MAKAKMDVASFLINNAGAAKPKSKSSIPELTDCGDLADRTHTAYLASKDAEAAFKALEGQVLELTAVAYEANARSGDFAKSLNLPGSKTPGVQVSYKDQFSALPIEQEAVLREQLGEKFDALFEQKRELSLVDTSDDTIKLLIKKLGEDEFRRIFAIKVTLATKPDMDRKQFDLPEGVAMLSGLKQYKPALKIIKD